jgi:hypothetical protein
MTSPHKWNFFRAGGFDQVQLDSAADLIALNELDQKLWVALSCPTRGLEFDARTLDLVDSDKDGHFRATEILAAITWVGRLLRDPDSLANGAANLRLSNINDGIDEGKQVLASARHVLNSLGKQGAAEISIDDVADIKKLVQRMEFNGDGVIYPKQVGETALRAVIEDIMKCNGSVNDASDEPGINQDICDRFFSDATAYSEWQAEAEGNAAILFLGDKTLGAADAFHAVRNKIDDYFTRCGLAAYDDRSALPLSRSSEDYEKLAPQGLSADNNEVATFPIAKVGADKPLPLTSGVNPAWRTKVQSLHDQVIEPLLGAKEGLSASEWQSVCARFSAFDEWQKNKPRSGVEQLGISRIREIIGGGYKHAIDDTIAKDKAVESEIKAILSLEKLLRFNRDLYRLVNNFVSFRDFYTGKGKAIFQAGTLYLDGRTCQLCLWVEDVAKHASFANMSGICLVYCDCTRAGGAEKMSIAAAFTAGDSDFLMVGRNGVFYDRKGQDWDANIVRIIDNPISIRQAFWSPYKKLTKVIGDQLQKFAASRAASVEEKMAKAATETGRAAAETPAVPAKPPFDVAKFAGIFAAIGLAIGAIGGILASVVGGVLSLKFWQIPLAVIGLMLLVSTPSVILAWFKLKRRNLGPILDANGWAINARLLINIPFGTSLTSVASLPEGAHRSMVDPFAEKKVVWPYYLIVAIGVCVLIGLWYIGAFGHAKIVDN